jgi:hypothetical protein
VLQRVNPPPAHPIKIVSEGGVTKT